MSTGVNLGSSPKRMLVIALVSALVAAAALSLIAVARPGTASANITHESFVTCYDAHLFANYSSSGGFSDPRYLLHRGERVGWRYNYDSRAAVVLYYRTGTWGYMLRSCLSYTG